jgi:hypothetical protein
VSKVCPEKRRGIQIQHPKLRARTTLPIVGLKTVRGPPARSTHPEFCIPRLPKKHPPKIYICASSQRATWHAAPPDNLRPAHFFFAACLRCRSRRSAVRFLAATSEAFLARAGLSTVCFPGSSGEPIFHPFWLWFEDSPMTGRPLGSPHPTRQTRNIVLGGDTVGTQGAA